MGRRYRDGGPEQGLFSSEANRRKGVTVPNSDFGATSSSPATTPTRSTTDIALWEGHLAELTARWRLLDPALDALDSWPRKLATLSAETAQLKASGQWRSGERTLLRVLGVHARETIMCRGLAWLLTADAWHGLGTKFASAFLEHLGLPVDGVDRVRTTVEELRAETRADLVIRTPHVTVVVEAKLFAGEQPSQCDRLADRWAEEDPALVFLTRDRSAPHTAVASAGQWKLVSWRDLAELGRAATADGGHEVAHGVHDLIETWAK